MNGTRTCTVFPCNNKHYARGWCRNHYNTGIRSMSPSDGVRGCKVEGCDHAHYGKGFCRVHWERDATHGDPNKRLKMFGASVAERLEAYSRQVGDCVEWTGCLTRAGYGQIEVGYQNRTTHRVAYELANGAIPAGLVVRHKCDNRKCIRPDHLEVGTHRDNVQDMVDRGRSLSGSRNPSAKLDYAKAQEIRSLVASGSSYKNAAAHFGVGTSTVGRVIRGAVWAER